MNSYKIGLTVPASIQLDKKKWDREEFYAWLWKRFEGRGILGVHEGTVLSEEAAQEGLEVDSWTVDSGMAPRERDWVGHLRGAQAEIYFDTHSNASSAVQDLQEFKLEIGRVEFVPAQDWDAEWKAAFLKDLSGVIIPPFWRILPPWDTTSPALNSHSDQHVILINPGAGFGTGTHETTQLCLEALGQISCSMQPPSLKQAEVLDFGSGSGILSVAAGLLGATVKGIEIDPLAIENALGNQALNSLEGQVSFAEQLPSPDQKFDLIIANILKPVLLEFSVELVSRLRPGGRMILSGLIEKDVQPVLERYSPLLKSAQGERPVQILQKGDWRALVF